MPDYYEKSITMRKFYSIIVCAAILMLSACSEKKYNSDDNPDGGSGSGDGDNNKPAVELPTELKERLKDNKVYVVKPVIYVARGGKRHGVTMSEERIRSFFTGWDKYSVNPMMLQIGMSFNAQDIEIINIELPMTDTYSGGDYYDYMTYFTGIRGQMTFDPTLARKSYKITDEKGNPTGKTTKIDQDKFRILLMDEGPTGGYAGGCPHRALVLNVNGATRNIIAHEVGHLFGLQHPDEGKSCFSSSDLKWVMRTVIYDESMYFNICETERAHQILETYRTDKKYRLKDQVKQVNLEDNGFSSSELKSAWELIHSNEYKNANRDLQE
jgi:hypothetical protein